MLGIASNNKKEILYIFAILNSKVTKFILNNFVKIAQEDTRTILVSLQIIKTQIRVPKINVGNEYIKELIIEKVEQLLKLEDITLSEFVDFSEILLQKFNSVRVEGNELVLEHDSAEEGLKIKGDASLVESNLAKWRRTKVRKLEESEITLAKLRELNIVDFEKQLKVKEQIDDLVFALYFNIPLKEDKVRSEEYIRKACLNSKYYETCN